MFWNIVYILLLSIAAITFTIIAKFGEDLDLVIFNILGIACILSLILCLLFLNHLEWLNRF